MRRSGIQDRHTSAVLGFATNFWEEMAILLHVSTVIFQLRIALRGVRSRRTHLLWLLVVTLAPGCSVAPNEETQSRTTSWKSLMVLATEKWENQRPTCGSFSNRYEKGKYVADGRFDPPTISKQCGAAIMVKALR